jgi:hypothetical protein
MTASALPIRAEFDGFLFAAIGDEHNGMPLTVASALARRGLDPWAEAARLADLPRSLAAQALAPLIAGLPPGAWSATDSAGIAARLVALLPKARPASATSEAPGRGAGSAAVRPKPNVAWLICLALLALTLLAMTTGHAWPSSGSPVSPATHASGGLG